METEKKCGCKGIRTCLICENEGKLSKICEGNKVVDQYLYCSHCNLCYPVDNEEGTNPLYLGKLTVIPDFVTEDEETEIIAAIDSLEWVPSQSGRKKQDFGPKVNFKKKKGKIGDFKGFPHFTKNLIKRLEQHKDLSDFKPVELCHLDYDPDRGSAIEPHIDDSWIWGERLVTINLASPTILTFTPANREANYDCSDQCLQTLSMASSKKSCCSNKVLDDQNSCLQTIKQKEQCKLSAGSLNDSFNSNKGNQYCNHVIPIGCLLNDQADHLMTSLASNSKDICTICNCSSQCIEALSFNDREITRHRDHKVPDGCSSSEQTDTSNTIQDMCTIHCSHTQGIIETQNKDTIKKENRQGCCKVPTGCFLDGLNNSNGKQIKDSKFCKHKDILDEQKNYPKCPESIPIIDMCTEKRIGQKTKNVEVLVPLPPRSLVVVAGCCRHNWFHEIKRKDIVSRRLAMTFRELSWNFMVGGPDQGLGTELIELGRTFWDQNSKWE